MKYYSIVYFYCLVSTIRCLECGVSEGPSQDDFKRFANICMLEVASPDSVLDSSSQEQNYDASYEDEKGSSLEETAGHRKFESASSKEKVASSLKHDSDVNIQNSTEITNNCVFHCVFKQLDLLDVNDYPDHSKISEHLVNGADNRELKDFLQDATDECFQSLEKDQNIDYCYFSANLIKCLAQKGRFNCSDWPMSSESSFTHIF